MASIPSEVLNGVVVIDESEKDMKKTKEACEFVYGLTPEELWVDSGKEEYVLVEAKAAGLALAALRCKTVGEYAKVLGYTLKKLLAGWGEELEEINDGDPVDSDTKFDLASIWGNYSVSELVPEPRTAAWLAIGGKISSQPDITVGHGAPGSNYADISAKSPEAFQRLCNCLNSQGKGKYVFRRDDSFVLECIGYGSIVEE